MSTLTRWLSQERDAIEPIEAAVDLNAELKRLRENAVLKQERDILKKLQPSSRKRDVAGERHWFERTRHG